MRASHARSDLSHNLSSAESSYHTLTFQLSRRESSTPASTIARKSGSVPPNPNPNPPNASHIRNASLPRSGTFPPWRNLKEIAISYTVSCKGEKIGTNKGNVLAANTSSRTQREWLTSFFDIVTLLVEPARRKEVIWSMEVRSHVCDCPPTAVDFCL